ncbi:hypothetical protein [Nesterenkonia haasae]|uniref:hypothetical protein n=1 Tax=Nesterenkonia haasae TaxID=2587813 RepID=UPI001390EEFA|nr:hypothetical protein [Nesterenkonia haasae]NDK31308.1 hypothetical protein [Nesterenkonia haasae]
MTQDNSSLTDFYSRAKNDDWRQQKQDNHRRWRRRTFGIGSAAAVVILVAGFIIYDYPRESGLTDALGITCGEYVNLDDPASVPSPMDDWETYQQQLTRADELDGEGFLTAVALVSEELNAEPQMGHVYEAITQRESSAVAAGETLMVGHHEELWSATDRVSVLDPEAHEITWTAELRHPVRDQDLAGEDRPRVLYGVGSTDQHVVLQTPTHRGDTDVVIAVKNSADAPQCVRLEGAVDTVELLTSSDDHMRAWSQTINLNAGRVSATQFLIHHGIQEDSAQHAMSGVDVATEEVDPDPSDAIDALDTDDHIDIPQEAQDAVDQDLQRLAPLDPGHYLLTWEAGYLVFATH